VNTVEQIADMLTRKKERIILFQEEHRKIISTLPKGAVVRRERGSKVYFQLSYYCPESKKNLLKYLGTDESVIPAIQAQIDRRKKLKNALKELNRELETIDKMLALASKHLQKGSLRAGLAEMQENPNQPPNQPPLENQIPPPHA